VLRDTGVEEIDTEFMPAERTEMSSEMSEVMVVRLVAKSLYQRLR